MLIISFLVSKYSRYRPRILNGYVVSDGKDLKIIAGASSGGVSFVVRKDAGIKSPKDFAGKKFASPQLGNTQDISLRS